MYMFAKLQFLQQCGAKISVAQIMDIQHKSLSCSFLQDIDDRLITKKDLDCRPWPSRALITTTCHSNNFILIIFTWKIALASCTLPKLHGLRRPLWRCKQPKKQAAERDGEEQPNDSKDASTSRTVSTAKAFRGKRPNIHVN